MAKEQIILEYQLVQKGGDKVVSTVTDITEAWEKSEKAATAALSEKQIDAATAKLSKFNTEVEKTATQFSSAKGELNALTKQITSGALQGKDLQLAVKRAAELKDRIGDVRQEIGRLSSDTRVFDTLVEGGRGVAAAFSVASGAAALFGKDNEALTKTIARAQGALALLTGVQELAKIATVENSIASRAYAFTLQVVDKVAKVTGLSVAASMAVATAGVTLLVSGAVALIYWLNQTDDATEDVAKHSNEFADSLRGTAREAANLRIELEKSKGGVTDISAQLLKNNLARLAAIEDANLKEKAAVDKINLEIEKADGESLARLLEERTAIRTDAESNRKALNQKFFLQDELAVQESENRKAEIEKKAAADRFKLIQQSNKEIENLEKFTLPEKEKADFKVKELTVTPEEIKIDKVPELTVPVKLQPLSPEETFTNFINETVTFLEGAKPLVSALSSISSSFFQMETSSLAAEKEKQLALVGDNAKKREAIEKQFAVKQAQLARKQAIANKIFSAFDIVLNTAQGISKTIATSGFPAAIPFIALAVAAGALQLAAVASAPLPEIPKFKEGIVGFKGKGTDTSDENLVFISNNESVMKGKATNKYREELQAANDLQLEDLIYHKYLLPALKQAGAADKDGNLYDDWNLRRTIKKEHEADRQNSKLVADAILKGMREQNYLTQRYLS